MNANPICGPIDTGYLAVRLFLGVVVLLAGSLKLQRPPDYHTMMLTLVPSMARPLARGLSTIAIVELVIGLWLIIGIYTTQGLAVLLLLFMTFTLLLIALIRRGFQGGCACFGVVDKGRVNAVQLLRNCVLLAATSFILIQSLQNGCVHLPI